MSQVIFEDPVKRITGKVEPQSNMSFRRNGEKVFTYTLQHPRTEKDFSEYGNELNGKEQEIRNGWKGVLSSRTE